MPKKKMAAEPKKNHIFDTFRENFNIALDTAGFPALHYGRQVEVASRFGISTSAARKWVMGECIPDWANLILIADTLGVSVDSLLGRGTSNELTSMVSIPIGVVDQQSSVNSEWIKQKSNVQFEADWLESGMRLKHNNLQLMVVTGDSMSPTLDGNDIVFVDTESVKNLDEFEDNAIYLFKHKGRPLLRRVQVNFDETFGLNCDNAKFPSSVVPKTSIHLITPGDGNTAESSKLYLIGRVQWAIKRVSQGGAIPM